MKKKLFLLVLAAAGSLGVRATDQIGMSHLQKFPGVIVSGMSYTLEAYIINEGTSAIGSGHKFDIMMSVHSGSPVFLEQGYTTGQAVAPGDSILWQITGYTFTTSLFDGGMNDVLVWPESGTGVKFVVVDSAHTSVLFTKSSAFSIYNKGVIGLPPAGPELAVSYDITVKLENSGSFANQNPVHIFVQFENKTPYRIADYPGSIEPGSAVKVRIPSFVLAFYMQYCWSESHLPVDFQIFAVEVSGTAALSKASFPIASPFVLSSDQSTENGFALYPNPVHDILKLKTSGFTEISEVLIHDAFGRFVLHISGFTDEISVADFRPGLYTIAVVSGPEKLVRIFVKD